jgi:hypothetical protein
VSRSSPRRPLYPVSRRYCGRAGINQVAADPRFALRFEVILLSWSARNGAASPRKRCHQHPARTTSGLALANNGRVAAGSRRIAISCGTSCRGQTTF